MAQAIEDTIKALTEFEAELDKVKTDGAEARKNLLKGVAEWAETAKNEAVTEARRTADQTISGARAEAQKGAESIRETGKNSLVSLKETMNSHRDEAVQLVKKRLLGVAKA
jgi:vacuolar-type H+-ATPase subunit H